MMASPDRGLRDNQMYAPRRMNEAGKGPDETQTADFILGLSLEHDSQVTSTPQYGIQTSPPTELPGSVVL